MNKKKLSVGLAVLLACVMLVPAFAALAAWMLKTDLNANVTIRDVVVDVVDPGDGTTKITNLMVSAKMNRLPDMPVWADYETAVAARTGPDADASGGSFRLRRSKTELAGYLLEIANVSALADKLYVICYDITEGATNDDAVLTAWDFSPVGALPSLGDLMGNQTGYATDVTYDLFVFCVDDDITSGEAEVTFKLNILMAAAEQWFMKANYISNITIGTDVTFVPEVTLSGNPYRVLQVTGAEVRYYLNPAAINAAVAAGYSNIRIEFANWGGSGNTIEFHRSNASAYGNGAFAATGTLFALEWHIDSGCTEAYFKTIFSSYIISVTFTGYCAPAERSFMNKNLMRGINGASAIEYEAGIAGEVGSTGFAAPTYNALKLTKGTGNTIITLDADTIRSGISAGYDNIVIRIANVGSIAVFNWYVGSILVGQIPSVENTATFGANYILNFVWPISDSRYMNEWAAQAWTLEAAFDIHIESIYLVGPVQSAAAQTFMTDNHIESIRAYYGGSAPTDGTPDGRPRSIDFVTGVADGAGTCDALAIGRGWLRPNNKRVIVNINMDAVEYAVSLAGGECNRMVVKFANYTPGSGRTCHIYSGAGEKYGNAGLPDDRLFREIGVDIETGMDALRDGGPAVLHADRPRRRGGVPVGKRGEPRKPSAIIPAEISV